MAKKNTAQIAAERARRQELSDMRAAEAKRERKVKQAVVDIVTGRKAAAEKSDSGRRVPTENVRLKSVATPTDPNTTFRPPGGVTTKAAAVDLVAELLGKNDWRTGGPSSPLTPPALPTAPMSVKPGSFGDVVSRAGGYANYMRRGQALPAVAEMNPLEQYLAARAPLNEADYVAPFGAARQGAQAAHDAAVPAIDQTYQQLLATLSSGAADTQSQLGENRQALVDQLARSRSELEGFAAQAAAGPHVTDPTLVSQGAATTAALQAAQAANADGRLALADRFAEIQARSDQGSQSDAGAAKAAALTTAQNNLQSLLGRIGLGEAEARQQFAKDADGRAREEAGLRYDMDVNKQKAEADQAAERLKLMEGAMTTPRREFEITYPQLTQTYPAATQVFEGLTSAAKGKGPMALAQAKRLLNQQRAALESGDNPAGKRFNVDLIESWLEQFYDDENASLSPRAQAELQATLGA